MKIEQQLPPDEEKAIVYVRDLKGFYSHLIKYVVVISILFIINLSTNRDYIWAWWPMLGWGLGIMTHGLNVFEVFHFFSLSMGNVRLKNELAEIVKAINHDGLGPF